MRRTKEQAAETGRRILRAAEDLFLEQGFDSTSLEQIAAAADVTRGAVHWHYKNKHGLLLALQDDAQIPFRTLADRLSGKRDPTALDVLGQLISNLLQGFEVEPRQRGLVRVMLRLDINLTDEGSLGGTTFREDMIVSFRRILHAVDDDAGLPKPWTPESAASTLCAMIAGLVGEWALGKSQGFRLVPDGQELVMSLLRTWKV